MGRVGYDSSGVPEGVSHGDSFGKPGKKEGDNSREFLEDERESMGCTFFEREGGL